MDHTSDPNAMKIEVDPDRLDLAAEFRAAPRGPHSPDLQRLLSRLRWGPTAGRYVLFVLEAGERWMLARQPDGRGKPLELLGDQVFTSLDDAEWEVFKRRWSALTGRPLTDDMV
ncbi:MAG: hypothetical protein AAGD34_17430 [Pseudomonadota bacterium]